MVYMKEICDDFTKALLSVDRVKAYKILEEHYAFNQDFSFIEEVISISLETIGNGWENGIISLAQVYMSGVICEELVDRYISKETREIKLTPRMAIAVLQDYHGLGKKIVSSIIRAKGYSILDFGQGLSPDEIVRLSLENNIEVLLISTLMLPSALKIKEVKDQLVRQNSKIKLVVGGAPFRLDPDLWSKVGADADGKNAANIIEIINKVVNHNNG